MTASLKIAFHRPAEAECPNQGKKPGYHRGAAHSIVDQDGNRIMLIKNTKWYFSCLTPLELNAGTLRRDLQRELPLFLFPSPALLRKLSKNIPGDFPFVIPDRGYVYSCFLSDCGKPQVFSKAQGGVDAYRQFLDSPANARPLPPCHYTVIDGFSLPPTGEEPLRAVIAHSFHAFKAMFPHRSRA
jgi:hypothetical protein